MKKKDIPEQDRVLANDKKRMLVSASAGSGKTHVMIEYISNLICDKKVPVKDFLVLTFTKSAATEMKERLQKRLKERLKKYENDKAESEFITSQLDALSTANICTIDSFCEKFIKKYANLLNLSQNFDIIDENMDKKFKQTAFEKALKMFENEHPEGFKELMSYYKEDEERIKSIIFNIENLVSSVADKDDFLKSNIENSEVYFNQAVEFLIFNLKKKVERTLKKLQTFHLSDLEFDLEVCFKKFFEAKSVCEILQFKSEMKWPSFPTKKEVGEIVAKKIRKLKDDINDDFKKFALLKLEDEENVQFQKSGELEKILINLFFVYEDAEDELKRLKNCLNFSDLERFMNALSVQENLFAGLQFVFIDEYQDTNKMQEKIIKNVAKNCNFVAVGDVKQGIYGFRLASSEIFLKDMKEFEEDEESALNILKSNFRSQKGVLDFANDVFKVCMTEETSGVDYTKSMLVGEGDFVPDGRKAIYIDVIEKEVVEEEQKPAVYSVKNAKINVSNEFLREIKDIKRRIFEVLASEISDNEVLRPCTFGDIAILSRSRHQLFQQLEIFLQESGIPVISNTKNKLTSEPEIKILLSYLKIALNLDDEIALMSVLMSGLYRFDIEEIIDLKQDENLCDVVLANSRFEKFLNELEEFRFDVNVFGIRKAFVRLFNKTSYRAYLNLKPNQTKLNMFVDKFLEQIATSEFQFDLAGLINYFESVEINVSGQISVVEDAVTLTTIHDSKGLEYPVVFLIGCDLSLSGGWPNYDVEINEQFGLALKYIDRENNSELVSAKMRAIKESKVWKEFAEELNLFYVALTRAKNRLYLFGSFNEENFEKMDVFDCDCYFDLIFFALKKEGEKLLTNGIFQDDAREFCILEDVDQIEFGEAQNLENSEKDQKICEKIEKYLKFTYKFGDSLNFRLKESVTALSRKDQEDLLLQYNNDNFTFSGNNVEIGNAYHLALKEIDFEKVDSLDDLHEILKQNEELFNLSLLDENILYKNIQILKRLTRDGQVFKEKEFIMKEKIKDILHGQDFEDEILVQGVVDLFVIKDGKVTLVDYKYSNSKSEEYLKNKYSGQLKLYKIAIQNSFNMNIDEIYLLSLKNASLIKVEI